MAYKIKKGDDVFVLSGKDKGKTGKVLKIVKSAVNKSRDKAIVKVLTLLKNTISNLQLRKRVLKVLKNRFIYANFLSQTLKPKNHLELVLKN